MELQAKLTALEEEVGILKVEIKSILQEVRVAVLARQNPFLADDSERPVPASSVPLASTAPETAVVPAGAPLTIDAETAGPRTITPPRLLAPAARAVTGTGDDEAPASAPGRPLDLAALLDWLQETAANFSQPEMVMLLTIASYGGLVDDGLKQALIELSQQVERDPRSPASVSDFSLALQKLEAIRPAATGQQRRSAA